MSGLGADDFRFVGFLRQVESADIEKVSTLNDIRISYSLFIIKVDDT